ncbi:MAG: hypothetical protein JWN44_6097 [Myxococcales bacterium]|nr:hypothetical protein [Myxococcales bacterium]
MVRGELLRVALLPTLMMAGGLGCIDTKTCHNPTAWKLCPGESAQPGGGGAPPSIVELALPTCTYAEDATVLGTMRVTDPDGDAAVVKATFFIGARVNESEIALPDSGRAGNEWSGPLGVQIMSNGGAASEGTRDVKLKVTDRAGAQSAPYCNTLTVVK